jgi:hypothetical protein
MVCVLLVSATFYTTYMLKGFYVSVAEMVFVSAGRSTWRKPQASDRKASLCGGRHFARELFFSRVKSTNKSHLDRQRKEGKYTWSVLNRGFSKGLWQLLIHCINIVLDIFHTQGVSAVGSAAILRRCVVIILTLFSFVVLVTTVRVDTSVV